MFTFKNKLLPTIAFALTVSVLMYLPSMFAWVVLTSSAIIVASYYVFANYDIDFKYCLSFVGQLLGLIFFVVSFLMIFTLGANFILV